MLSRFESTVPNFVPPLEKHWYHLVSDGSLVDRPEKTVSKGV